MKEGKGVLETALAIHLMTNTFIAYKNHPRGLERQPKNSSPDSTHAFGEEA